MKNGREPNDADGLLNAVLADADWQALNCSLKGEALATVGAVRRKRRWRLSVVRVAAVAVLVIAAVWWLHSPAQNPGPATGAPGPSVRSDLGDIFISEDQMLAMFPPGSCVVAEVDGQKELVFLDAEKAQEGFVLNSR